jgi:hypothetical protein
MDFGTYCVAVTVGIFFLIAWIGGVIILFSREMLYFIGVLKAVEELLIAKYSKP